MTKKLDKLVREAIEREDIEELKQLNRCQNFLLNSGDDINKASNSIYDFVATAANKLGNYYDAFCAVGLNFDEDTDSFMYFDKHGRIPDEFASEARSDMIESFNMSRPKYRPIGQRYEMELLTYPIIDKEVSEKKEKDVDELKVPQYARDGRYGIIQLAREKAFDDKLDTAMLGRFARFVWLAANDYHSIGVDQVTKKPTRKSLLETLKHEKIRKEKHPNYQFSVMMFDLDRFKDVNDNYGHPQGDSILKEFSELLDNELYSVVRWGGEEFAALVRGAGLWNTREKAENLRKKISKHEFKSLENKEPIKITSSIGVAEYDGKDVIRDADKQLYLAKENGRNRVYPLPTE